MRDLYNVENLRALRFKGSYAFWNASIPIKTSNYLMGVLINSLAPGRCERNFRCTIFKPVLVIDGWGISCEITLRWMSLDLTDDKSTLVQVMAWCRQATSHYLIQCWTRLMSPNGVTRPHWVKVITRNVHDYGGMSLARFLSMAKQGRSQWEDVTYVTSSHIV